MAIDGFRPEHHEAFVAFDAARAERFFGLLDRIRRRVKLDVVGLENLPRGRALLVANHAFGWDVMFVMAAVWRERRQTLWALGEHLWWRVPFLRSLAAAVGTVDGTQENVDQLLGADQLVIVLPGGLREAVKPATLRYQLLWGRRYGFIRAAIRNQAPIVPVASVGSDEIFDFVGDAFRRGRRWTGVAFPIPFPARILPIPHFTHLSLLIGEPIPPPPVETADDPATLKRYRHEVSGALHELIEDELARRAGIDLGGNARG